MNNSRKGTIIIFVVVIIGIIGVLYASIYTLIGIERKINQSLVYRTKAYYFAESGLERGAAILKGKTAEEEFLPMFPFVLDNPFSPDYKQAHQCTVELAELPDSVYKLRSEATIEAPYGTVKRIMEAEIIRTDITFSVQSWKEVEN